MRKLTQRTEAVVSLGALRHNIQNIRSRIGSGGYLFSEGVAAPLDDGDFAADIHTTVVGRRTVIVQVEDIVPRGSIRPKEVRIHKNPPNRFLHRNRKCL